MNRPEVALAFIALGLAAFPMVAWLCKRKSVTCRRLSDGKLFRPSHPGHPGFVGWYFQAIDGDEVWAFTAKEHNHRNRLFEIVNG